MKVFSLLLAAAMMTGACMGRGRGIAPSQQMKDNKSVTPAEWSEVFGGPPESGELVIRDAQAWKALWETLGSAEAPEADFGKQMALAVFLGLKPTGGYSVRFEKVETGKKEIRVRYAAKEPGGAIVIQALTAPYAIRLVERSELPVVFERVR